MVAEQAGVVRLEDVIEDKNLKKDEQGNFRIFEYKMERLNPRLFIGDHEHQIPTGAVLLVKNKQKVKIAEILLKISSAAEKHVILQEGFLEWKSFLRHVVQKMHLL